MLRMLVFYLVFVLFTSQQINSQTLSNRGKEFWLGYGFNYSFFHEPPVNTQQMQVYISADQAANVTVSIANTSYSKSFNIPAGSVDFSVVLPKSGPDDARILSEGLMNRAVCIKSDVPVAVYAHQYNTMVSGATMLVPKESLGYSYYSVNYAQYKSGSRHPYNPNSGMQNGGDWYSWFYVVGTEDGTRVLITPSDTTQKGWLPNQTYTVDLKKGEIYQVMGKLEASGGPNWKASKDMTGSKVVSIAGADGKCHPIAVFSGSGGIRLCWGDGGEYVGQQMLPSRAWGTRYLTYHMINNTASNLLSPTLNFYRVCVLNPKTIVKKNGLPLTGLINNFFYEFSSTSGDYIESDNPILVSQYTPNANRCVDSVRNSYGDPEMIFLSPIEQGQKSILFYTPRKMYIDYVYGSIYLPSSGISSLRVDDAPIPASRIIPHPTNPAYSIALARFTGPAQAHKVTCDSNFNAYIYGIGFFESYGFTAGTKINDLNSYPSFRNSFKTLPANDTITCPKTPFRVAVQVAYPLTSITWNLSQTPGISFTRDTTITNPNPTTTSIIYGRKYYHYSLDLDLFFPVSGEYDIPYSYTSPEIDQCDKSETGNLHVKVNTGPKADFDTTKSFCFSDDVKLMSTSNDNGFNIIRYQWDFQDGTNITTKDAVKKFPASGKHPVRYRIFSDNGCTGDTTKNMIVLDEQVADFTISGPPCKDSTLTFTSKILTPPNITLWCWESPSGKVDSTRLSPGFSYVFNTAGKDIPIKHWAIDANGCKSTIKELKVKEIFNAPAAPLINILSDTLCIGSRIKIDATAVSTAKSWKWDVESIGQFTNPSPINVVYQQSGTFNIRLSFVSSDGCGSLTGNQSVTISALPKADAGPDVYINAGSFATLEPRMTPPNNFHYQWTPSIGLNDPNIPNPICTPLTDTTHVMRVWDKATYCSATDSMRVIVIDEKRIPNTFSPNNDGVNDLWELRFLERCMECRAEVYTTNGILVWRSTTTSVSWNGRLNGRDLPVGTYYYVIKMPGAESPVAGYVTILR